MLTGTHVTKQGKAVYIRQLEARKRVRAVYIQETFAATHTHTHTQEHTHVRMKCCSYSEYAGMSASPLP